MTLSDCIDVVEQYRFYNFIAMAQLCSIQTMGFDNNMVPVLFTIKIFFLLKNSLNSFK